MTPTEKYLIPHTIFGEKTFDEYCSDIPEFYFRKEVPEDVIKNFEVVEKLLALSFYEYKFIDEAYAKAIHSFEMAMLIRYKDFYPESKKVVFSTLITKLSDLNLFDTGLETLNHVKFMRNHYSHPERHSYGGIAIWNRIEFISRLVNEMYEDVNLRAERRSKGELLIKDQQAINLDQSLVFQTETKTIILFSLRLLFINNKHSPNVYVFAATPLFNLESESENHLIVPQVLEIKITNPIFQENILTGKDFYSKQVISFSSINGHKELLPIFESWQTEWNKKRNKVHYELSISSNFSEIYVPAFQEFQRM